VCYELGVGIELCAPLCPGWFLLVGSLANALKSTSYMMRLPPRAAFLKSFARRENVGGACVRGGVARRRGCARADTHALPHACACADLSAKANAQEVRAAAAMRLRSAPSAH
jgi:hypothetical protein